MSISQTKKSMHKSLSTTALPNKQTPFTLNFNNTNDIDFTKTTNTKTPNFNGHAAEILFKRQIRTPSNYDLNLRDSGYIIDGGINFKYQNLTKPNTVRNMPHSHSQRTLKPSHSGIISFQIKKEHNKTLTNQQSAGNILKPTSPSLLSSATPIVMEKNNNNTITNNKTTSLLKHKKHNTFLISTKGISHFNSDNKSKKTKKFMLNNNNRNWNKSTKIEKDNKKNIINKNKLMRSYSQGEIQLSSFSDNNNKNIDQEKLKIAKIGELINKGIHNFIKDLQLKCEIRDKTKETFFKKHKALENHFQDSLDLESVNTDLSHHSHEEIENSNESNLIISAKLSNNESQKFYIYNNNNIHTKRKTDPGSLSVTSPRSKKIYKNKVDQFEFLKQIYKNKKLRSKKNNNSTKNKNNNNHIVGDSFRQGTSPSKKEAIHKLIDSKVKQVNDNEGNYLFSYQQNKQKKNDVKKYMRNKKIKDKIKQANKENEQNKELLRLYERICPLNTWKRFGFETKTNNKYYKKSKSTSNIRKHSNTNTNMNRSNNSTLIDQDEYCFSTLVCKQLINMDENDILNLPQTEIEYTSETISKRNNEIHKSESEKRFTKIEGLKKKVDKTVSKADNIYNKGEIEELIISSPSSTTNKDLHSNNNNKEIHPNIINDNKDIINNIPKDSLENSPTKEQQLELHLSEQKQNNTQQKQEEFIKTTSEEILNTKDKYLPSLSHSFNTNTNPNNKIKIEIEPRCVLNLVEIIKLIIQRRTFYTFCEIYAKEMFAQRLIIACNYFIAILKYYPYKKLEEYVNYDRYQSVFIKLVFPYIRKYFYMFIMKMKIRSDHKLEYFVTMISKYMKFKIIQKMYKQLDEHIHYRKCNNKPTERNKMYQIIDQSNSESKSIEKLIMIPPGYEDDDKDIKLNTYLYESYVNTSKDTTPYVLENNSADSPKLRRLFQRYFNNNQSEFDLSSLKEKGLIRTQSFHINNEQSKQLQQFPQLDDEQLSFTQRKKNDMKETHTTSLLNLSNLSNKSCKSVRSFQGIFHRKNELELTLSVNNSINDKPIKLINTERNRGRQIHKNPIVFPKTLASTTPKNHSISNKNLQIQTNIFDNNDIKGIISPKGNEKMFPSSHKKGTNNNDDLSLPIPKKGSSQDNNKLLLPDKKESGTPISSNGSSNNFKNRKSLEIHTDQDYSLEKESNNEIDWQYCLSSSKTPGKDISDNSNTLNKKEDLSLSEVNNKISPIHQNQVIKSNEDELNILNITPIIGDKEDKHKIDENSIEEIIDEDINIKHTDTKDKKEESYGDDFEQGILNNLSSKGSFDAVENIIGVIKNNEASQELQKQNQSDKSRNTPCSVSPKQSDQNKSNIDDNDIKNTVTENKKDLFNQMNIDILSDEIVNDVIDSLLNTEIKNPKKIIPNKPLTYKDNGMNSSLNPSLSLSRSGSFSHSHDMKLLSSSPEKKETLLPQLSQNNPLSNPLLADNLYLMPFTYSSIFNKTVKEKKREQTSQLYTTKIGPQLIKLIKEEIILKYPEIYDNISSPYKNIPKGLITSLLLQDPELLRNNYRVPPSKKEISDIIDKSKLLDAFKQEIKTIRLNENIFTEYSNKNKQITYDEMLNNCLIDSAIELINKERLYGEQGDPLPWSTRTREIKYKYDKTNPHKLANYIEIELMKLLNNKIGMITENYDHMTIDQINMERERRLVEMIRDDLKESEPMWNNLEMEETQIKVEVTELILEQLYNEVIEILEHIEYSRKKPELYQHKSIFACEEIPKLTFQVTGNEEQEEEENEWTKDVNICTYE